MFMKPINLVIGAALLSLTAHAVHAQTKVDGDPQKGRNKSSMCVGCHQIPGYRASYPLPYSVPMIVGQNAKYIENALQAYKKGERKHPTMRSIAETLTDDDMKNIAAYYSNPSLVAAAK
jgi:cytochrome c553